MAFCQRTTFSLYLHVVHLRRDQKIGGMPLWFKFSKPRSFDPARDLPDLTGKVAIVTGGKYVHHRA